MKLATLRNGARDGMLVVVSRDLTRYVPAQPIAATLQAALDNCARAAPKLHALARDLEIGAAPSSASANTKPSRRCRAPISGPTARPT